MMYKRMFTVDLVWTPLSSIVLSSQIYVEIERARLIKRLAKIKEEQGLIAEAADLMQEVAVSCLELHNI